MKSQRRHELQLNTLSIELTRVLEFLKKNGNYIAWGALGVALVAFIVVWYVNKQSAAEALEATKFHRNVGLARQSSQGLPQEHLEELKSIASGDSNPRRAALANVEVGDYYAQQLAAGWLKLSDVEKQSNRGDAQAAYQKVLDSYPNQELAVAKAHYGLGKLDEEFGQLDAARDEYQKVRDATGLVGQPVVLMAEESLMRLAQLQGQVIRIATTEPSTAPALQPATAPAARPSDLIRAAASQPAGQGQP